MPLYRQTTAEQARTFKPTTTEGTKVPAPLSHFAINADDVDRARRFYAEVFGWNFNAWGPPGFFHINTGATEPGHPIGALQTRRELITDEKTVGFECTIAVDDIDRVIEATVAAGGRVLQQPTVIAGVGELVFIEDSEGNAVGAMRYDPAAD